MPAPIVACAALAFFSCSVLGLRVEPNTTNGRRLHVLPDQAIITRALVQNIKAPIINQVPDMKQKFMDNADDGSVGPWPEVFIVGAQKAATSSLWHLLATHPQLCVGTNLTGEPTWQGKEIHFFDSAERFAKGETFYRRHFGHDQHSPQCRSGQLGKYMDASPQYSLAFQKINQGLPAWLHTKARFVVVLREQAARDLSWYNHMRSLDMMQMRHSSENTYERDPTFPQNTKLDWSTSYENYTHLQLELEAKGEATFLQFGNYAAQLESFTKYFQRNQLLVLNFVTMLHKQEEAVRQVTGFLGVDPKALAGKRFPLSNNRDKYKFLVEMDSVACETRAKLGDFFRPINEKLYVMLHEATIKSTAPFFEPFTFTKFTVPNC